MSIYDLAVTAIDGTAHTLAEYRGHVLLIVNVASRCGYTPQYEGLEALHRKYRDRSFAVLGFPCNQFGAQEPGSDADVQSFCQSRYEVTFPLFSKIDVNGDHAHPLYQWLKSARPGVLGTEAIKWNFTKFLISRAGEVVARYGSSTTPAQLEADIDTQLSIPA